MRQKPVPQTSSAEKTIKDIRRATRKHYSAEDKIRIFLEGLRGEDSIAAICGREGIAESLYYSWSKESGCTCIVPSIAMAIRLSSISANIVI